MAGQKGDCVIRMGPRESANLQSLVSRLHPGGCANFKRSSFVVSWFSDFFLDCLHLQ